jgi:hypothetical protein
MASDFAIFLPNGLYQRQEAVRYCACSSLLPLPDCSHGHAILYPGVCCRGHRRPGGGLGRGPEARGEVAAPLYAKRPSLLTQAEQRFYRVQHGVEVFVEVRLMDVVSVPDDSWTASGAPGSG